MLQAKASGRNLSAQDTTQFYGLNRTSKGMRGESEDMTNMCSDQYPCAAPAHSRVVVNGTATALDVLAVAAPLGELTGFTGVAGNTTLGYAFYYNGVKKSNNNHILNTGYVWQIVVYNNTYLIYGRSTSTNQVKIYTYNVDSDKFKNAFDSDTPEMDNLIVVAGKDRRGNYLRAMHYRYPEVNNYDAIDDDGNTIHNYTYFDKYFSYGNTAPPQNIFEDSFSVGDQVTISGFPTVLHDSSFTPDTSNEHSQVWSYTPGSGSLVKQSETYESNNTIDPDVSPTPPDDRICVATVSGFETHSGHVQGNVTYYHTVYFDLYEDDGTPIDFVPTEDGNTRHWVSGVTVSTVKKVFDHLCLHDGRLWGTTLHGNHIYGSASDRLLSFSASDVNEGYAKRYTSLHWGKFTGLCSYKGYIVAFKEDVIELVYGTRLETAAEGIGCIDPNSVAVTPNGVIFLGRKGFYLYNLSAPQLISSKLGSLYTEAVGAFDGNVYFVSALNSDGTRELLAYDMRYGLWHKRDDYEAKAMFRHRENIYFIGDKMNTLSCESGTPGAWSFTTVRDNNNTLDNKAISELWIYADAANGATFTVYTAADNGGFVQHSTFTGTGGLMTFRCPVRIEQCTFYRVKIAGEGSVTIHTIETKTASGKGRRIKERTGTELPEPTVTEERIDYA